MGRTLTSRGRIVQAELLESRAMRIAVLALLALGACGKEPDPPAPPPAPSVPAGKKVAPSPPAERLIAFARHGNLWVMKPDGSGARAVTDLKGAAAASPAWSPDRQWIAFT